MSRPDERKEMHFLDARLLGGNAASTGASFREHHMHGSGADDMLRAGVSQLHKVNPRKKVLPAAEHNR